MKQIIYEIIDTRQLTETVFEMKLRGDVSGIKCGQFVNLLIDGLYLRRPISVCDLNGDTLTLVYKVVGKGTQKMSEMKVGEKLDVLTQLGNGYDLSLSGKSPLLIGGGVGVPPIYGLCKIEYAYPKRQHTLFLRKDYV